MLGQAKENVDENSINLQASRQEMRTQILLWSTGEKLSALQTLNNTMFLWEDHPAKCGTLTSISCSDVNVDLVLSSLAAAKEGQRRLFDSLDGVQGVPRRAICCSAVRELVRAYPPERLVPTSFLNDHFVTKLLQQTVCIADHVSIIILHGISCCKLHYVLTYHIKFPSQSLQPNFGICCFGQVIDVIETDYIYFLNRK